MNKKELKIIEKRLLEERDRLAAMPQARPCVSCKAEEERAGR
jgi:hypothetical protein